MGGAVESGVRSGVVVVWGEPPRVCEGEAHARAPRGKLLLGARSRGSCSLAFHNCTLLVYEFPVNTIVLGSSLLGLASRGFRGDLRFKGW